MEYQIIKIETDKTEKDSFNFSAFIKDDPTFEYFIFEFSNVKLIVEDNENINVHFDSSINYSGPEKETIEISPEDMDNKAKELLSTFINDMFEVVSDSLGQKENEYENI